jgi:carboxypeptidase Taq
MTSYEQTYSKLCNHAREVAILSSAAALLGWDERTKMPAAAGAYRAEQISYLAGLIHRRQTAAEVGEWLVELAESPLARDHDGDTGADILNMRRDYDRKTKLPQALVEELAKLSVLGQQVWAESRRTNDFAKFRPLLERTIELKREEASAIGYQAVPYDALLDEYEPQETTANVKRVLADLRQQLVPLVAAIAASKRRPNLEILRRRFAIERQETFGWQIAAAIGFDFTAGRLDVTDHPFCAEAGPRDVRLTTRYDEHCLPGALFSTMHEAGHGMYEQGLPPERYGLPTGQATSLGIHESQSRMWENLVGRSRAFWEYFLPKAREEFSESLSGVSLDDFYFAVNDSRPSLIRTESDEVTYNLHIMIRFELEQALIMDELRVADLPGAWNQKYQDYLGVAPPNDSDGVLQDVHWSGGALGYFPTYTLGNLYAAQFFEQAEKDLGDLSDMFRGGEFRPLLDWLRVNIHCHGRRYSAAELVQRVTGKALSHDALMRHLRGKFGPLYDLN